jgi:hypothetical protein
MEDRRKGVLSDEEFEAIARRAAELSCSPEYAEKLSRNVARIIWEEIFPQYVGTGLISKGLWILGAAILALAGWLSGAGKIKFGG